jgi:hypothetical protein
MFFRGHISRLFLAGETSDLAHLAVDLSPNLSDLASSIIQQIEGDAEHTYLSIARQTQNFSK